MNRKIMGLAGAAFGLLALSSAPAAAQYGSAPQPAPQGQSSPPAEAPAAADEPTPMTEVLRAAACAMGRDANPGTALLATVPRSAEERSQAVALLRAAQRCLRLREPIATSATQARAAFAECALRGAVRNPGDGAHSGRRRRSAAPPGRRRRSDDGRAGADVWARRLLDPARTRTWSGRCSPPTRERRRRRPR